MQVVGILVAMDCISVDYKNITGGKFKTGKPGKVGSSAPEDNNEFRKVMAVQGIWDLRIPADKPKRFPRFGKLT